MRVLILAFIVFSVGSSPTEANQITTKDEYLSKVAGRKLTADWGWVIVEKDGSLSGKAGSRVLKGSWYWKDRFWCRVLLDQDGKEGDEDCQVVSLKNSILRGITKKGKVSERVLYLD